MLACSTEGPWGREEGELSACWGLSPALPQSARLRLSGRWPWYSLASWLKEDGIPEQAG